MGTELSFRMIEINDLAIRLAETILRLDYSTAFELCKELEDTLLIELIEEEIHNA